MTSRERIRAALEHRPPDRPPVWEYFWPQWEDRWLIEKGFATREDIAARGYGKHNWERPSPDDWRFPWEQDIYDHYDIDLRLIGANTDPFLDGQVVLEEATDYRIVRDGWGVVQKVLNSADASNVPARFVNGPIDRPADLKTYSFDSPSDPRRFVAWSREVIRHPRVPFFVNLQGPFAIYCHLRGMETALVDVLDKPGFVHRVTQSLADFEIEVGTHQIRLAGNLGNPVLGVWIFEDIAYNRGLLISPQVYRETCLPALRRIIRALRGAGAEFVIFHSDGDIRRVIPMLIEAGVNAIQPMEVRAGMDVVELQATYSQRLAFIGNVDNTGVLARGTTHDIRRHVMQKVPMMLHGGYIIGSSHSIGLDVPTDNYEYFRDLVRVFPHPNQSV